MNRNDFKKQVMNYFREKLGEYDAGLTYSSINNEAGHECLSLRKKEDRVMITIGIKSLFDVYKNDGSDMALLADKILDYYNAFTGAAREVRDGRLDIMMNNVYCRLINYEMNKEKLQQIPHERKLDMAVVYFMRIRVSESENAGVILDYSKFVNKDNEEIIKAAAWENTLRDEPASVAPLSEMAGYGSGIGAPVYVVSNTERYYGAICIYYPHLLQIMAEDLGSDLYIIPSSVHECIVMPTDIYRHSGGLKDMLHMVNRAELERYEILSDSVYIYNAKNDVISIDI